MWKGLSEAERRPFLEAHDADKERYNAELRERDEAVEALVGLLVVCVEGPVSRRSHRASPLTFGITIFAFETQALTTSDHGVVVER